jgi:hypothetical protein
MAGATKQDKQTRKGYAAEYKAEALAFVKIDGLPDPAREAEK